MKDILGFEDEFIPVPPGAVDADPAAAIEGLLFRVGKLERTLESEQTQALADQKEALLTFINLSDDIAALVEKWGVTTKAQEAAIIRGIVALGRKVFAFLKQHGVEAIPTIGQPLNPDTSDVVGRETRDNVAHGIVLRETQVGYKWRHGVLRRAQVVVNQPVEASSPAAQPEHTQSATSPRNDEPEQA